MYKLKKIDIGSVAIYSFIMFLILGVVIMLPAWFFSQLASSFSPEPMTDQPGFPGIFGGFFFIAIPLFYAVFGTLMNVIIAFVYNVISIRYGGIKIELNKTDEE